MLLSIIDIVISSYIYVKLSAILDLTLTIFLEIHCPNGNERVEIEMITFKLLLTKGKYHILKWKLFVNQRISLIFIRGTFTNKKFFGQKGEWMYCSPKKYRRFFLSNLGISKYENLHSFCVRRGRRRFSAILLRQLVRIKLGEEEKEAQKGFLEFAGREQKI